MKKILLIEDDQFIRDLTTTKLRSAGFDVAIASTAEEAEQHIQSHTTDLIILDLELPAMQGDAFLESLRGDERFQSMPVIVFSNNDEPEMKELCTKLGIRKFFVKINTDFDELLEEVNAVLS